MLAKLGSPSGTIGLLRRLHEQTHYVVRTKQGDSQVYTLQRGVREGCPSSCSILNLYHNEVLKAVKTKMVDDDLTATGLLKRSRSTLPQPKYGTIGRGLDPGEELIELVLHLICFADDTSAITRGQHHKRLEEMMVTLQAAFGETVHPGKTERMRSEPWAKEPEEGYEKAVRLLGGWIDCDGGARTDTSRRLQSAGKIWSKMRKQIPRLRRPLKSVGRLIESTVLASLLYAVEVRVFFSDGEKRDTLFLNRIVRNVT